MHKISGSHRAILSCLLFAAFQCTAVETHIWDQSDPADFARGTAKKLSVRSDGHLTLAPVSRELDSTSIPYLWVIAQDSKGTVYYAGGAPTGATTKIFALPHGGKGRVFAEVTGLEVHALAVDSQDRLYAAVLPDAKIYRIDSSGKPQLFFDPKCKYIWSMAFDRTGALFVATGDAGLIYRVTPDGKGVKFFDSQETHVRSMAFAQDGNLIVGTEPSGLVLRITPEGESFVLYQTNKREVTAVAERNGLIYAAAVGNRTAPVTVTGPAPVLPSNPAPITPTGAPRSGTNPPSLPPSVGSLSASVSGGSELYRIERDGYAEHIWRSNTDVAYALAFDSAGKPLLGTGNKGVIYRIDSDQLSTQLLSLPPTQITAFLPGKDGLLYVATGNVGNLYSMANSLESSGSLISEVFDAHEFTYWGKAHMTSNVRGGAIVLETRSGNLSNPETSWSPWTKVNVTSEGGQVPSPPARFLQYRVTLNCSANSSSPELNAVDIAYLPKNIAPKIGAVEIAPFNYRQAPTTPSSEHPAPASGSPTSLTLSAVGQKRPALNLSTLDTTSSATLQYNKGYLTVRWSATDANNDPLNFKVEIKPQDSSVWRVLKDKLADRYYAFDSTVFPDGKYIARITAADAPGNIPSEALTNSLESDVFTIDNTPPEITDLKVNGSGTKRQISFTAKDALSWIDKTEYSLNGSDWTLLQPVSKVTDSQSLTYRFEVDGDQAIAIRVFDENDNVTVKQVPPK
ncbi:MAG: hypothetical protein JO028_06225 [Acidobacteriaceae bacterium]|nr:hypothetical protein [Acidobacteriaceae bacterium]